MAEFNTTESLNQAPKIDSVVSIRCAKVARLLSDLRFPSPDVDESAKKEITAELKRELKKLKIQLLKEREKNKKMQIGQVVLLLDALQRVLARFRDIRLFLGVPRNNQPSRLPILRLDIMQWLTLQLN